MEKKKCKGCGEYKVNPNGNFCTKCKHIARRYKNHGQIDFPKCISCGLEKKQNLGFFCSRRECILKRREEKKRKCEGCGIKKNGAGRFCIKKECQKKRRDIWKEKQPPKQSILKKYCLACGKEKERRRGRFCKDCQNSGRLYRERGILKIEYKRCKICGDIKKSNRGDFCRKRKCINKKHQITGYNKKRYMERKPNPKPKLLCPHCKKEKKGFKKGTGCSRKECKDKRLLEKNNKKLYYCKICRCDITKKVRGLKKEKDFRATLKYCSKCKLGSDKERDKKYKASFRDKIIKTPSYYIKKEEIVSDSFIESFFKKDLFDSFMCIKRGSKAGAPAHRALGESIKWSVISLAFRELNKRCCYCGKRSSVCDHVIHYRWDFYTEAKFFFFNIKNLQPLCKRCHDKTKARYDRKIYEIGSNLQERRHLSHKERGDIMLKKAKELQKSLLYPRSNETADSLKKDKEVYK